MIMNIRSVINIRYAQIRSLDLSNGEGIGMALFVQGCRFRCPNCFNPETWDFNGGKEWTQEVKNRFLELANRPYIKRISILGGEPLADENLNDVLDLVNRIRLSSPQKTIWLYSGYKWETIVNYELKASIFDEDNVFIKSAKKDIKWLKRREVISLCDILVDGRYVESQRDLTLKWRGSSNQRVIDIKRSLKAGEIVLYDND